MKVFINDLGSLDEFILWNSLICMVVRINNRRRVGVKILVLGVIDVFKMGMGV